MNDLKVGDKVKFLNTSGGGVVAKLIDTRTVSVMIEDGFEIPTMISELVKINSGDSAARFFEDHYDVKVPAQPEPEVDLPDDQHSTLPFHVTSDRKSEDIYLAFVPHDQKWLVTGQLDVILINNSSCDVLYNIFRKTPLNHFEGVDYGSIFPDSTLVLKTINREQVTHWTDGYIQFLFHKEQCKEVLPPFNAEFRVDGKRFFKEGNYRQHQVIKDKGIVLKILSLTEYFRDSAHTENPHPASSIQHPGSSIQPLIFAHQIAPREAEVDLHIHELVEDPSNLEKNEILDFQKNYFLRCLDSAMANHFLKVTFIHGVGNGVLRTVLIGLLQKQGGISFSDAPMAKYGIGALEIKLPHANE
jgi:hypothetical protein